MAGLKPNDFFWIIEGKLAVSECIGGGGLTARKIRREEEIQWLKSQGINSIFSLLDSDFNLKNYQEVGFRTYHFPLGENVSIESVDVIFEAIKEALSDKERKLYYEKVDDASYQEIVRRVNDTTNEDNSNFNLKFN